MGQRYVPFFVLSQVLTKFLSRQGYANFKLYTLRLLVNVLYRFKNSYDCQNSTGWHSDKVIKHGDVREVAGSRTRQVIINLVWTKPPDSVTINHSDSN